MPMSTNALQNNQGGNPDFDFDNGKGRRGYTRWCKARREERKKSRQNGTKENSDGNGQ